MGLWVSNIKTTIELSDDLIRAAKRVALERRTTLRQLVENGLRRELSSPSLETDQAHPLQSVIGLGLGQWVGEPADAYVDAQRADW